MKAQWTTYQVVTNQNYPALSHEYLCMNTPLGVVVKSENFPDLPLDGLNITPDGEFVPAPGFDAVDNLEPAILETRIPNDLAGANRTTLPYAGKSGQTIAWVGEREIKLLDNIGWVVDLVNFVYMETFNCIYGESAKEIRERVDRLIDLGCFPEIRKSVGAIPKRTVMNDHQKKVVANISAIEGIVHFVYMETHNNIRGETAEIIRRDVDDLIDAGCFPNIRKTECAILEPLSRPFAKMKKRAEMAEKKLAKIDEALNREFRDVRDVVGTIHFIVRDEKVGE